MSRGMQLEDRVAGLVRAPSGPGVVRSAQRLDREALTATIYPGWEGLGLS